MNTKTIAFADFRDNLRDAALAAIDSYTRSVMETPRVDGWKDKELPALFAGLDAHAKNLASRINEGHEINSAYVSIDMES